MDLPREVTSDHIRLATSWPSVIEAEHFRELFNDDIKGTYGDQGPVPEGQVRPPGPFSYAEYTRYMEVGVVFQVLVLSAYHMR